MDKKRVKRKHEGASNGIAVNGATSERVQVKRMHARTLYLQWFVLFF